MPPTPDRCARTFWEWELTRIEGSHWLPMGEVPGAWTKSNGRILRSLFAITGCAAWQVVAFLQRAGFTNLHNLAGGIDAWARQVDPAVTVY